VEEKRIIIRTTSNICYVGRVCDQDIVDEDGFLIKTSLVMNLMVWIPAEEVDCIIDKNVLYSATEYKKVYSAQKYGGDNFER